MHSNQSKKRPNRFGGDTEAVGARSSSVNDSKDKFINSTLASRKPVKTPTQPLQTANSTQTKVLEQVPPSMQKNQQKLAQNEQKRKTDSLLSRSLSSSERKKLEAATKDGKENTPEKMFLRSKLLRQKQAPEEEKKEIEPEQGGVPVQKNSVMQSKKGREATTVNKTNCGSQTVMAVDFNGNKGETGNSKASLMQEKFEKRMSARNDLIAMKKQILETNLTEEDKKCILVYFRHKIMSLIKTADERLKKHNAHPKFRKKVVKSTKNDSKDVSESFLKEEIWSSLKRAISTKSKYKFREVINFEKKVMNAYKQLNEAKSPRDKKAPSMVDLADEQDLSKKDAVHSKSPEKTQQVNSNTEQENQIALKKSQNPNLKLFFITGGYPDVRKALESRGWIENLDKNSKMIDLKWTVRKADLDFSTLTPNQIINHFDKNTSITTKSGLCRSTKNLIWFQKEDIDNFFPRCFDLNDIAEFDDFIEDFKLSEAEKFLKIFKDATKEESKSVLLILKALVSLEVFERRLQPLESTVDQLIKGTYETVTAEEWDVLLTSKLQQITGNSKYTSLLEFLEKKYSVQFVAQADEKGIGKVKEVVNSMLKKIAERYFQSPLNTGRNVWIVKPAGLSRGRGIACHNNLPDILDHIKCKESEWIAQKYLENLLIVKNRKFDIRQWVLVTDWDPLNVWFYERCYIRFGAEDYSLNNLSNRYAHLTNNSVIKYSENFDASEIEGNMWFDEEFSTYLKELCGYDVFEEKIRPAMKNAVIKSLLSVQDMVENRKNAFEMYGYDFMVDENFNTWLIEINSSPSMEYSTHVTEKLVKMVLEDVVKVVIDLGLSKSKSKKEVSVHTGNFTRIYQGNI